MYGRTGNEAGHAGIRRTIVEVERVTVRTDR
jgi:hypothetical protein